MARPSRIGTKSVVSDLVVGVKSAVQTDFGELYIWYKGIEQFLCFLLAVDNFSFFRLFRGEMFFKSTALGTNFCREKSNKKNGKAISFLGSPVLLFVIFLSELERYSKGRNAHGNNSSIGKQKNAFHDPVEYIHDAAFFFFFLGESADAVS